MYNIIVLLNLNCVIGIFFFYMVRLCSVQRLFESVENRGRQCQALVCQGWQSSGSLWRQQFSTSDRRSRFASVDRREKPLLVWRTFRVARYNLHNNWCITHMLLLQFGILFINLFKKTSINFYLEIFINVFN